MDEERKEAKPLEYKNYNKLAVMAALAMGHKRGPSIVDMPTKRLKNELEERRISNKIYYKDLKYIRDDLIISELVKRGEYDD